jgi:predicted dehydrogenase
VSAARSATATGPVRLGIVGAGGIAKAYADLLPGSMTAIAAGVADVRGEAADTMADVLGCPAFADPAELAAVEELEAVVLCTPPATHPAVAQLFFDRGVAVLCEKPLAVGRHAARQMVDAAEQAGVLFTMATKFRFCDDVNRVRDLVAAGELGAVRLIENAFTSRVDMSTRWNSDPAVSGGGVLVDNGTHSVDLARHLGGPIAELLAVETCRPEGFRVDDTAKLFLRHESGVDTVVDLSWSIDKSLADFLRVYGTDGEARVGWRESAWRPYGQDWQVLGSGYAKAAAMGGALDAFCLALRGEAELVVTSEDALAASTAIDAAYESLARGGWVKLAELDG